MRISSILLPLLMLALVAGTVGCGGGGGAVTATPTITAQPSATTAPTSTPGTGGPAAPSGSPELTDLYEDPLILDYYQQANAAWVESGSDIASLRAQLAGCSSAPALPVLSILSCTDAAYDTLTARIRADESGAEISLLYDQVLGIQNFRGRPVLRLPREVYPDVPVEFRLFYSWIEVQQEGASGVLGPIVGPVMPIAELAAAPYGEFARLTALYDQGEMKTVVVNVNPIFLDSVPDL